MGRTCEVCGSREAGKDEEQKVGVSMSVDTLFVCESCRKDRQSHDEVKHV